MSFQKRNFHDERIKYGQTIPTRQPWPSCRLKEQVQASKQLLDAINASDPEALQAIVDVTVKAAREGRPWAITAILDRVYPPLRDRTVTFDLPPIRTPEDIPVALDAVLQAVSDGTLSPAEGSSLCGTIIDCNQKIMTDVHVYLNTVKKLAEAGDESLARLQAPY